MFICSFLYILYNVNGWKNHRSVDSASLNTFYIAMHDIPDLWVVEWLISSRCLKIVNPFYSAENTRHLKG
jgi:hypothetical protein